MRRDMSSRRCGGSWACTHYRRLGDRMSENENVKEHQGTKRSLNYLSVGVVGIPAKSCPMVGDLGSQRLLWDAGEEGRDVDSLTSRTDPFV